MNMMQNERPFIQVYILCYNRTEFVKEAVASVLKQSYLNFEVIVSDNSTNNEVFEALNTGDELNKFKYIRRPGLTSIEHHNLILKEVTAPFFMMFHDDDVLQKNALQRLITGFNNELVVAVGANGFIIKIADLTNQLFNPYLKVDTVISNPEVLAEHHLVSTEGIVPFPVYLYKSEIAKKNIFSFKEGNKYADASYLLKLSESGPIVWLADPLINYRQHTENGSVNIDIRATLSLCRFVRSRYNVSEKILHEFKMKQFSLWSLRKPIGTESPISKHRTEVIRKASIIFLLKNPQVVFSAVKKRIKLKLAL